MAIGFNWFGKTFSNWGVTKLNGEAIFTIAN